MLLKATHLPIVGAIWLFERVHDRVRGGAVSFSSLGPISSTDLDQRAKKQIPFLSKSYRSSSAKHDSQHFVDLPHGNGNGSDPHTPIETEPGTSVQTVVTNNPNLERMVEDLTTKIAELTALVMAQQGTSSMPEGSY